MTTRALTPIAALAWSYGIVLLLLRTPASWTSPDSNKAPGSEVTIDVLQDQIYAVAIDELLATFHTDIANVVEQTEPIGSGPWSHAPGLSPDRSFVEAASDYEAVNQAPAAIWVARIPSFHVLRAVAARTMGQASRTQPVLSLSRVGFNADKNRAVLYMAFSCGNMCAQGDILWLRRTPGDGWRVIERQNLWVS